MKKIVSVLMAFLMCFALAGCEDETMETGEYEIFYLNRDATRIEAQGYDNTETEGEALIWELLGCLSEAPKSSKLRQTIPATVRVNGVKPDGVYLTVDFSQSYKNIPVTEEVLMRAAIVRTLLQIPGVSFVSFTVESEPLRTINGTLVGNMDRDSFVENPGAQINTSTQTTLKLYFSNKDGTRLVEETRVLTHSTSTSVEKLVMEQLIAGPTLAKGRATIPAATKLINVSVLDGVCYVSVDSSFQNQDPTIKEEIVLFSIVNSLTELPGVTKVQLSVNGETKGYVRYTYELSGLYDKNPDLVEKEADPEMKK